MSVIQPSLPNNWLALFGSLLSSPPSECRPGTELWRDALRDLTSGAGLHQVELTLRKMTRCFQNMLLETLRDVLRTMDAHLAHPPCPNCSRAMWKNRLESLKLQLLEGELSLTRWYCECRPCGTRIHPLDIYLGLPAKGEFTPQFGQDLCLLFVHLPARTATELLQALTGRSLSAAALHQHVQREGEALVALERKEADALWPWDENAGRRTILSPDGPSLRTVPAPRGGLIAELDGVFANLGRESAILKEFTEYEALKAALAKQGQSPPKEIPSRFREVRQARLYRLEDRVTKQTRRGGTRTTLSRSETVSVVNDPDYFQRRMQAVTHAWRSDQYEFTVVLGDGGAFVWEIARTILNATYEILDIQHARSHIYTCGRALFGEGTAAANAWSKTWCHSVSEKGPDDLLVELKQQQMNKLSSSAERVLKNLIAYVNEHRHRMNYPEFRRLKLPVASGAIESANRQVVGDRCKRSGMRWTRSGLQRLLSLRAMYLSGNWMQGFAALRAQRALRCPGTIETKEQASTPATIPVRELPESVLRADPEVESPEWISPRKVVQLLREGFLRRTASGKLEETR